MTKWIFLDIYKLFNMKKIIAVLVGLALLGAPSLKAQQFNGGPRNDFNVSYGYFTLTQFATVLGGVFGAAFSLGNATPQDILSTGSIQLEYLHRSNNWLWLGFNVSGEKDTLVMSSTNTEGGASSTSSSDIITGNLCFTAKANWLRRQKMAMYTRLSAGVFTTFGEDDNSLAPSIQLSLLGLEAGSQNFRGFVELGVGMHGILSGGFRYLF